jgi:release factor glutamine methyltransferase
MSSLYAEVTSRLKPFSDTPALDASVLLAHILQKPRTWVMAHPESNLTTEEQKKLNDSLARLERGEPFPYVLGKWEFFNLEFDVTKDVLIPRPETELLVERAIAWLQVHPERSQRVADIGTGSGAIAVSVAVNIPTAKILATDISPAALDVAKRNAQKHNVQSRIESVECDLLPNSEFRILNSEFDLLCANLPYIPTETMRGLSIYGREPTLALDGGLDGFDLYRRLFKLIPNWLAPRGAILLEIESSLGAQTIQLASNFLPNAGIKLHQDLAGKDRLIEIQT